MIVGQHDDIKGSADNSLISEVQIGEQAHRIYQAVSRGCCRFVDNGQAKPMHIYLINRSPKIKPLLDQVMPGAVWCNWLPKYNKIVGSTMQDALVCKIENYLRVIPETLAKIPTKAIKQVVLEVGADTATVKCFDRALKQITGDYFSLWNKVGHSIVRLSLYAE